MDQPFKEILRQVVLASGMTKVDFAKNLRVSHAYLHQFLGGTRKPSFDCILRAEKGVGVDEATFLELLAALVREDPELTALACHLDKIYFRHLVFPIIIEFVKKFNASRKSGQAGLKIERGLPSSQRPWIGVVYAELAPALSIRLPKTIPVGAPLFDTVGVPDLVFFVGRPDAEGIGIGYVPERGFPLKVKRAAFHLPIVVEQTSAQVFEGFSQVFSKELKAFETESQSTHVPNRLTVR